MTGTALLAVLLILQPSFDSGSRSSSGDSPGTVPDTLETVQDSLATVSEPIPILRDPLPVVSEESTLPYRSPGGALLRSAILPGWGQFYNDKPLKGLVLGAIEAGLLGFLVGEHLASEDARNDFLEGGDPDAEARYETHSQRRLDLIWYTSAAWLYGMLDAYVDAHLFAFDTEIRKFGSDAGIGAVVHLRF